MPRLSNSFEMPSQREFLLGIVQQGKSLNGALRACNYRAGRVAFYKLCEERGWDDLAAELLFLEAGRDYTPYDAQVVAAAEQRLLKVLQTGDDKVAVRAAQWLLERKAPRRYPTNAILTARESRTAGLDDSRALDTLRLLEQQLQESLLTPAPDVSEAAA